MEIKTVHLSFDDVNYALKDITINKNVYKDIWQNSFFKMLWEVHELYGGVFSLYVFYKHDGFLLNEVTSNFRDQFIENSGWLKFGFHGYSPEVEYNGKQEKLLCDDFDKAMLELERIVGRESIDNLIRLHRFEADRQEIGYLGGKVWGFLTADDDRISYGLPEDIVKHIDVYGKYHDISGITYVKTDMRLERLDKDYLKKFYRLLKNKYRDHIEIFTHEWCAQEKGIQEKLRGLCLEIQKSNQCRFEYYQNR